MSPRALAVLAMFFGPVACAADQLFSYVLVYPAQASGTNLLLHVLTAVAAAIAGLGLLLSYRVMRQRTGAFEVDRFLGVVGVTLNAFFLLVVIIGFELPKLVLTPTD